jgi:membrane protease YdiL (CAAX protease family)
LTSEEGAGALPPALDPETAAPPLLIPSLVDVGLLVVTLVFFSGLLVAAVLVPGFASLGAAATPGEVQGVVEASTPALTVAAIAAMLLTAIVIWGLRRKTLGPLPAPMETRRAYALAVVAGIVIQAGALAVFGLMSQIGMQVRTSNAEPLLALIGSAPWLAALMVVVAAPLAEELLFRHVLLRRYLLAGRAGLGLVLTSALFAVMHEPVPGEGPVVEWLAGLGLYAGMGIAFGLVYLRTGRLGAAFLAHAVCNLSATAMVAYSAS